MGLSTLLDLIGYDVVSYGDPAAFIASNPVDDCAVILLDMRLPRMSGLEVRSRLEARGMFYPIVFISSDCAGQEIIDAMKGGAVDFLMKPFSRDALEGAIQSATAIALERHKNQERSARFKSGWALLSPRECDVLELMLLGYQNRHIAQRLGIQPNTIKKYRATICEKFGVATTAQLIEIEESLQAELRGLHRRTY